ncbi:endophilin-B1a isoform X2 [Cheilinus undulatus]|uniref:endophilin-B1a isoform X2 n=1 Tax=Cheilinus undulatus TaxID=241271 RepID=UPI001BD27E04|nr:endophilin-B1a isoform X2 [Cheilinus undulatus]
MDFNVKRLAADAGTFLSRAVQFTEEKLGQAEKTELDAHLENLLVRAENTKQWTERIMKQTEVLLQPNPNVRLEEFVYEKLEKKAPTRMNNHELLGQSMIESGNEFGPGTAYGNALIKCGETQKQIGGAERELIQCSAINFLTPFRNFLEGDFKTIQKERKLLQVKRLDLDAAKTRLKKARMSDARVAAEQELRMTQSEFDRQAEITRLLLEGVSSTHGEKLFKVAVPVPKASNPRMHCSPSSLSERLCGSPDDVLCPVLPVHGGPPETAGQFPLLVLQQQSVICVRWSQHLRSHHPSVSLSAQRLCRPQQLYRSVRRIQRAEELQRQPQSSGSLRL